MDKMYIRDLRLNCIIGTNPDERVKKQDVIINITIECDLLSPGKSDKLDDTLNYRAITKDVISLVEKSQFLLIEKMADEIACLCLEEERAVAVTVMVDKPGALTKSRSAAVEIRRTRQ